MAIDVASWLQQLGLAQYEPAFRDNEVDGDVLPDLTADDLIGLGVTLIGALAGAEILHHSSDRGHRSRVSAI